MQSLQMGTILATKENFMECYRSFEIVQLSFIIKMSKLLLSYIYTLMVILSINKTRTRVLSLGWRVHLVNDDTTVVATNCDTFPFPIFCFPSMCILFPCDNTFLSLHWIEDA